MIDTRMTDLENKLKECYMLRQDIQGKILTDNELSDYISWLMNTDLSVNIDNVPDFLKYSSHTDLAFALFKSPADPTIRRAISSTYGTQLEASYILENNDISINRMLRYMPAQWHQSNFFKVYYTLAGNLNLYISDTVINMKAGTVVIVAPEVVCATPAYNDQDVLLTIMLRSTTFQKVFWNNLSDDNLLSVFFRQALEHKKSAAYIQFETGNDMTISETIDKMYREYFHPQSYSSQMINTLMSEFFILLLRQHEGTVQLPRTESFYWKQEYSAILHYIQNNYTIASIDDVAEEFHYSRKQISRIVKEYTGETYSELTYRLKMNKAAKLLKQRSGRIENIAFQCGYSTLSSFQRAFTHYFHMTPGNYRKLSLPD